MLYLLFVLTFLAGILFYGMSPSDKSLDMTAHQAEGMIVTFLAQHQAAKDYLYAWLGGSNDATTGNLQGNPHENFLKADDSTVFDFREMISKGVTLDTCEDNQGTPGKDSGAPQECFVSRVVCTNSAGTASAGCNDAGAKHYVITYGGWAWDEANKTVKRPDWWPGKGSRMRRFESWRQSIANRTRGSISCGTLVRVGSDWCIDNGKTIYKNESATSPQCMNVVPTAVINALSSEYTGNDGKDDLLFCISEFKQGLDNYVSGATYFYDGLANAGIGQHHQSSDKSWVNLGSSAIPPITSFQAFCSNSSCVTVTNGVSELSTDIPLSGSSYTITVLAEVIDTSSDFDLFANLTDSDDKPIFKKEHTCSNSSLSSGECFTVQGVSNEASFTSWNAHNKLISWTIVVDAGDISIYENALLRHEGDFPTLKLGATTFKMKAHGDTRANIYGIRYYPSALSPQEIQKNFKVDQKRFGIGDVNNGMTKEEKEELDKLRT